MRRQVPYAAVLVIALFFVFSACSVRDYISKPPQAVKGVVDLRNWDFQRRGPVKLTGEWEFYWKELRANFPDTSGRLGPDHLYRVPSTWTSHVWKKRKLPAYGYATFRLVVYAPTGSDLAVRILGQATSYRMYVNGRLTAENGTVAREKKNARPQFRPLTAPLPRAERLEIVLHVSNHHHRRGGMWSALEVGEKKQIQLERESSIAMDLFLAGTMLIIGLYHLGFFALRRQNPGTLQFSFLCLLIAVRAVLTGERFPVQVFPGMPWELVLGLEYLTFFLTLTLFVMYVREIFPDEYPRFAVRIAQFAGVVSSLLVLVTPITIHSHIIPAYQLLVLVFMVHVTYSVVRALLRRRSDAGLFLTGTFILLVSFINDILFLYFLLPLGGLTPYGMITFIFSQALLLTRRFSQAFLRIENLSGELEQQSKELVRLDKLKDEFLSNTSHELRTPLQGIIGMADSLKEHAASDTARHRLDLIMTSGRRLSGLVNNLLDFSKLRHRDMELNKSLFDLREFTEFELELTRFGIAREKPVQLVNAVPEHLPPVLGDRERVAQILQNLLSNAVKHTDEGEIRVTASVDEMVAISVRDSGTGVPPEARERIFRPFEQGSGDYERKRGGTGLGLSIARSLAELHGGSLRLEESTAPGAVFTFTLPMADSPPSPRTAAAIVANPVAPPRNESADEFSDPADSFFTVRPLPLTRAGGGTVLVVDDEPVLLEVMRTYLEQADIKALGAENADEMQASIKRHGLPDCLVLDIMMPGISGLEAARELRKQYSLLDLPILMVTARTRTMDLMAALEAGANDYLVKPFEKKEFLSRVGNLVSLSKSRRDARESRLAVRDAARKEREKINADLHDHLGASLLDLKLMAEAALENPAVDRGFARKLTEKLYATMIMLRGDLIHIEDLGLLEEDFISGMHMILLRRYMEAGREINFRAPENLQLNHESGFEDHHVGPLYAVIQEIATNDLKYGIGTPRYDFSPGPGYLKILFESQSRYELEHHGTGHGTQGMIRRLAEIGGKMRMSMLPPVETDEADERIHIEIELPGPVISRAG